MNANDVARQPANLGDLIPDVRVGAALCSQLIEFLGCLGGLSLLDQQIDACLAQRVAARVLAQHALQVLLRLRQTVGGDLQFDLGEVVDQFVRCLVQQRREDAARVIQLPALDLCQRQAIARGVEVGILVELCAEAFGAEAGRGFETQLCARADQLVTQAVLDAAVGELLGAVGGVGDARLGNRVRQQKFRRFLVVAILAHQAGEHLWHGAWIVAGLLKVENADAVCFLLVLP